MMKYGILLLVVMVLLLAACSGNTPDTETTLNIVSEPTASTEDASPPDATSTTGEETTMEDSTANTSPDAAAMNEESAPETITETIERPAWQTMSLTNAQTGETFTLADYAGKTVFVEPMATWCTNCRAQLTRLRDVQSTLSGEDFVFVALSVETNLEAERLANYAVDQNFPYTFAVLSPEMLAELVREFGSSVSTPPSTPHFIIRPDGTFTELATGAHSADSIIQTMRSESGL